MWKTVLFYTFLSRPRNRLLSDNSIIAILQKLRLWTYTCWSLCSKRFLKFTIFKLLLHRTGRKHEQCFSWSLFRHAGILVCFSEHPFILFLFSLEKDLVDTIFTKDIIYKIYYFWARRRNKRRHKRSLRYLFSLQSCIVTNSNTQRITIFDSVPLSKFVDL